MTFERLVFVFLIICVTTCKEASARDQHMICKSVEDVFERNGDGEYPSGPNKYGQGRPGKLGAKGARGEPGPKGEEGKPGVFDVNEILPVVDRRIQTAIQNLEEKFDRKLSEAIRKIKEVSQKCELRHTSKCFWSTIHTKRDITYPEAAEICIDEGGRLADISNAAEYEALADYLRSKTSVNGMQLWIGTSRDQSSGVVSNFNGSPSLYQKWFPGYPLSGSRAKQFMIQLSQNKASSSQGMFNFYPDYDAHGVVCQM